MAIYVYSQFLNLKQEMLFNVYVLYKSIVEQTVIFY